MPPKEKTKSRAELILERNRLMISKENPERLAEIKAKIDFLDFGIK